MLEHARSSPGREVCGLIGGSAGRPASYYPVENDAPDPGRRFLMHPEAQLHTMRRMRDAGEELLGIFHSHPGSPAEPSATDRELACYPDVVYFIASLLPGTPELRAWYFDGADFKELPAAAGGDNGTAQ